MIPTAQRTGPKPTRRSPKKADSSRPKPTERDLKQEAREKSYSDPVLIPLRKAWFAEENDDSNRLDKQEAYFQAREASYKRALAELEEATFFDAPEHQRAPPTPLPRPEGKGYVMANPEGLDTRPIIDDANDASARAIQQALNPGDRSALPPAPRLDHDGDGNAYFPDRDAQTFEQALDEGESSSPLNSFGGAEY
jgi:hypothetical protein